jgi:hypothetical protein
MGPFQQFLRHHLLEHHPQCIRPRSPFGAWGREEKQEDCKTDIVSIHQLQYLTTLRNSRFIPGVRLRALYVCALLDDPEEPMARLRPTPRMIQGSCSSLPSLRLPFSLGGSRFRSSLRRAMHQMLGLFSLQPRCWEEGGPVGGCQVVVDNSGTTLRVPTKDFSVSGYKKTELIPKKSNTYRLWRILCRKQIRNVGNCVHVQQHSFDPDERGIVSQLLCAHPRRVFSTYVLEA